MMHLYLDCSWLYLTVSFYVVRDLIKWARLGKWSPSYIRYWKASSSSCHRTHWLVNGTNSHGPINLDTAVRMVGLMERRSDPPFWRSGLTDLALRTLTDSANINVSKNVQCSCVTFVVDCHVRSIVAFSVCILCNLNAYWEGNVGTRVVSSFYIEDPWTV